LGYIVSVQLLGNIVIKPENDDNNSRSVIQQHSGDICKLTGQSIEGLC